GIVVPEEDVPALAATLQQLHDDPAECSRLGAAGRRRVMDQYSDAAVADQTLRFWREILHATA
ncbi:MAG: glycosyltransferase, partial [Gemmatimonadales bacterium]